MNHEEAQAATAKRLVVDALKAIKHISAASAETPHYLMPEMEMRYLYLCDVTMRMGSALVGNLHLLYAKDIADAYSQAGKFIESLDCTIVESKVTMCPNGFTVMHRFYPPIREIAKEEKEL